MGRLTHDPELKTTPSQKSVSKFTLAVNRPFKTKDGNQETDYISCVAWSKTAENICKYVTKGQRIIIEGSLRTRNYEAKDGTKRYVSEVFVESFEFIEKKGETNGENDFDVFSDEELDF